MSARQLSSFLSSEVTWQLVDGDLEGRRQRGSGKTEDILDRTLTQYVRLKALNIS